MENATVETVMTYVVAFLSSTAGVTMVTIIAKAIVNAICTYKSKKVSKLNDADKAQIANEVTNAVLSAISDGVNINAEAMIDRATNKRLDVMDRKFNEFSELLNKIFSVNIAQGKVLVDLKTPSLSARENLASAIGDNHKEIEQIPVVEQPKLTVTIPAVQETKEATNVSY